MTAPPQRRHDIDIARAFAMFAVVSNHLPQYFDRYLPGVLNHAFHQIVITMTVRTSFSLFMFVAGVMLASTNAPIGGLSGYFHLAAKKFCRLILPFVAASLLTLVIKLGALGWGISDAKTALIGLAIAPRSGPAPHLWFLYCLMSLFLIWPLLRPLTTKSRLPFLLLASVILAIVPISWPAVKPGCTLFGVLDLTLNLPIFLFGFWYGQSSFGHRDHGWLAVAVAGCALVASALCSAFVVFPEGLMWTILDNLQTLAGLIVGAVFLLWLGGRVGDASRWLRTYLLEAGWRSYDIYLLHVALIGHPLAFLIGKLHPAVVTAYVLLVVAIAATYLLPILIGMVIRLSPPLAFVMLGLPMPVKRTPGATPVK
jgi:peptidoglycan/LPS O-acetylase OafA/YrhL